MEQKMNILLADADDEIRGLECDYLMVKDCEVRAVVSAAAVMEEMQQQIPTVCVLSANLLDQRTADLVQSLRTIDSDMPIVVYGDPSSKEDMLAVYRAGADVYLNKPFPMEVLLMQMQSLWRLYRVGLPQREGCYDFGNVYFDANSHQLGTAVLSSLEAEILDMLCRHRNEVVSSDVIRSTFWTDRGVDATHLLPVYIHRIRKYLECAPSVAITSVHGVGYKLVDVVK